VVDVLNMFAWNAIYVRGLLSRVNICTFADHCGIADDDTCNFTSLRTSLTSLGQYRGRRIPRNLPIVLSVTSKSRVSCSGV
jgi:hypothetical protein